MTARAASFTFFTLSPSGTGHWIASTLAVLMISSAALWFAARRRRHTTQNNGEIEKLYRLANAVMESGNGKSTVQQIADQLLDIFELNGVTLFDRQNGQIARAGIAGAIPDQTVQEIAARARPTEFISGFTFTPIRSGDEVTGTLGLSGGHFSQHALNAVAGRVAVGLAQVNAFEQSAQAEISRRCEELKSAILDALAHEIRGPLNSIKIAVTSLSPHTGIHQPMLSEMLTIIEEEADRMNAMIDDAMQLSHVNAANLQLDCKLESVPQIVSEALDQVSSRTSGRPIEVQLASTLPPVDCDSRLLTKALKLLLDNALKYSPAGSPVRIAAESDRQSLLLKVANDGPTIPDDEKSLIFERYYRGRFSRRGTSGTGLGLPSAKTIVEAHGGRIWVVSPPAGGAEFDVLLPLGKDARQWAPQAS